MNADMDDFVLMKLEGEDVDLMCDVNPSYRQHVLTNSQTRKANTIPSTCESVIRLCSERIIMVPTVFFYLTTDGI